MKTLLATQGRRRGARESEVLLQARPGGWVGSRKDSSFTHEHIPSI